MATLTPNKMNKSHSVQMTDNLNKIEWIISLYNEGNVEPNQRVIYLTALLILLVLILIHNGYKQRIYIRNL